MGVVIEEVKGCVEAEKRERPQRSEDKGPREPEGERVCAALRRAERRRERLRAD
jgi:hypothetical protein